jgi:anaerobic C4-dicarboxylate transporter
MQKVSAYFMFIALIFVIKLLFFLSILRVIYAKMFDKRDINRAKEWKRVFENMFMLSMALLIVYLFQKHTITIGKEEHLLFMMFASVIVLNVAQDMVL